jgi:hypothetical protein
VGCRMPAVDKAPWPTKLVPDRCYSCVFPGFLPEAGQRAVRSYIPRSGQETYTECWVPDVQMGRGRPKLVSIP